MRISAPGKTGLIQTAAPGALTVSVAEAKTHMRVDGTSEDTLIENMIKAVTRAAEDYTHRAFITQDWRATYDAEVFTSLTIPAVPQILALPRAPLQSLQSVKTYDDDDSETAKDVADFHVDVNSQPGRICLKDGKTWPTSLRPIAAIEINYRCGYGDASSDVSDAIREAILHGVGEMFENREQLNLDAIALPNVTKMFLCPFRILQI